MNHIKDDPIGSQTLKKYMELLGRQVKEKTSKLLPEKFALVFDGWSAGDEQYVGILFTFSSTKENEYARVFLAF